jgi:predicted deacylase
MRVEQLGDGDPELAIVGGIHGDEPCGPAAVGGLIEAAPAVERPVKLIVANEEALERGVRYVDEDLNRAFPGDPEAATREGRLAVELLREIRDLPTLALHSTQSYGAPFALTDWLEAFDAAVFSHLSVDAVIETGSFSEGRLVEYPNVLEVECGYQRSAEAAENARMLCHEFLAATGALPQGDTGKREVPVFELLHGVAKPSAETYEVFVENFTRVDVGETFATADGEAFVAEEPFYPVLMSPYGYESVFGYAGDLTGRLDGEEQGA